MGHSDEILEEQNAERHMENEGMANEVSEESKASIRNWVNVALWPLFQAAAISTNTDSFRSCND